MQRLNFNPRSNGIIARIPAPPARRLIAETSQYSFKGRVRADDLHVVLCTLQPGDLRGHAGLPYLKAGLQTVAGGSYPVAGYARGLRQFEEEGLLPAHWLGVNAYGISGLYDLRQAVSRLPAPCQIRSTPANSDPLILLGQLEQPADLAADPDVWAWVLVQEVQLILGGQVHATFRLKQWDTSGRHEAQQVSPHPVTHIYKPWSLLA